MKRLFAILFAMLIILSGMHLTLAVHLCGGEISDTKLSIARENASCGMCGEETNNNTLEAEGCCDEEIYPYAVDTNYSPSFSKVNETAQQLLPVFLIPAFIGLISDNSNSYVNTNARPPGEFLASAVSLPGICVFLI